MPGTPARPAGSGSVSIQDVAREAGVATSTVSRALTMPGRIAEKTRARVLEAANRLGYTANAAARNLRLGRTGIVLIVLPGPFNAGASQVIAELLTVVDAEIAGQGYSLLIANIDRQAGTERYILDLAFGGVADGAVVISSGVPRIGARSLLDSGIPVVSALFDFSRRGVPSIVTDDRAAARHAVEHLIGLGHRDLLYVGGPPENYHEIERHKGVRRAIAGRDGCSLLYCPGVFDFASGVAAAETFLRAERRPTAAFCCNDDQALGFIRRLADAGISTPADVSVVGFDGSAVGAYTVPSLTSVRQPTNVIGQRVVRTIIDLMARRGEVPRRTVVPSTLVVRESVGPPPSRLA